MILSQNLSYHKETNILSIGITRYMNQFVLNKKSLLSILLFLVIPLLGFTLAIYNIIKTNNRKVIYVVISLFFAVLTIKNPPIHDIYRYLLRFDSINSINDIGLYTNDYFFDFLTLLFKFLKLPFYLIPPTFVFSTLLLILLSIDKILNFYNIKGNLAFLIIFSILIIANPINISLGLRSHLAFSFILYGIINLIITKNNRYLIYLALGFLTHTASFILILSYFISKYFKSRKATTILLSLIAFLASKFLLNFVFEISFISDTFSTLSVYKEFDNLSDKSSRGLLFYYIETTIKMTMMITYFLFYSFENKNYVEKSIYYFLNILIILTFASSMSEIAFGRYSTYVVFFIILLFLLQTKNKFKITKFIVLAYLFFTLLVTNIYINRNTIETGNYLYTSIESPLFLFLYTDNDYRKLLSNTDFDGYPKSGPGAQ